MANRKPFKRRRRKTGGSASNQPPQPNLAGRSAAKVSVRRAEDGTWELRHPRCAMARADDLEEVEQMIAAGETEIARNELLWLLHDCHDFIAAHAMLGELALSAGDVRLARGHFGYAYQIGMAAIDQAGHVKPLTHDRQANRAFHEAGKKLAQCLVKLGKRGLARDVAKRLMELDPSDPLRVSNVLK